MNDEIDYRRLEREEAYNKGYKEGREAGIKRTIEKYVDPGSFWNEFVDAHGNFSSYHCSNCKFSSQTKEDFCPNCKARMRKD